MFYAAFAVLNDFKIPLYPPGKTAFVFNTLSIKDLKEISAISDQIELFELYHLLQETGKLIKVDKAQARKRAEKLVSTSFGVADAAHLVFAEAVGADFITCDDKLCKKCCTVDTAIWTGNPVAFCDKEGLR